MSEKPKRKLFTSNEEAVGTDASPAPEPVQAPPPFTASDFVTLKVADVDTSPTNPRKDFDKEKLQQLAADITARGVLQPVTVRKKGDRYELVFGERRFRASKLAGTETIPALVRQLTDEQALEAQLMENTGEPLKPLELAFGYQQLREKEKLTVDQLAAKVGRSRISVYNTLKLLELGGDGRKYLEEGQITMSVAQLAARVPASLQGNYLSAVAGGVKDRWGHEQQPVAFRQAQRLFSDTYMKDVGKAPFDPEDAGLCPKAGPCSACPKRAGNMPGYIEEAKKSPNVCTDFECFRDKTRAAAEAKAAKKGLKLLSRDESEDFFRHGHFYVDHSKGWVDPSEHNYDDSKHRAYKELLQPEQYKELARLVLESDGTLHEVLAKKALAAAIKKAGIIKSRPERSSSGSSSSSSSPKPPKPKKPAGPPLEEKQLDAVIAACVDAVEKKGIGPKLIKLLARETFFNTEHLTARRGLKERGYGVMSEKEFDKVFGSPKPAAIAGILVESIALDGAWSMGDDLRHHGLVDAAELLGVDIKKVCKEVEAAEQLKTIRGRPITHIDGKPVKKGKPAIAKKATKASKKKKAA